MKCETCDVRLLKLPEAEWPEHPRCHWCIEKDLRAALASAEARAAVLTGALQGFMPLIPHDEDCGVWEEMMDKACNCEWAEPWHAALAALAPRSEEG